MYMKKPNGCLLRIFVRPRGDATVYLKESRKVTQNLHRKRKILTSLELKYLQNHKGKNL
jgi:hypothetical protein